MEARNQDQYIAQDTFAAFRNISPVELEEITKVLTAKFSRYKLEHIAVPGSKERRSYPGPVVHRSIKIDHVMDIWEDSSNAGYCAYISPRTDIHEKVEKWGAATENNTHITMRFPSQDLAKEVLEELVSK